MSLLLSVVLSASLIAQSPASTPLRLKAGDVLAVVAPETYGGEFSVMSDGAIYGKGFGRLNVAGLTILDSEKALRIALKRFVKEQQVFVTLKAQRPDFVFLVGQTRGPAQGPTPWLPDITLRQVLSQAELGGPLDQLEVSLLRQGQSIYRGTVEEAMRGGQTDPRLNPNDIVSILPMERIRVWIGGAVRNPGEIRILPGSDLSRAIASVGGFQFGSQESIDELVVVVRRGPQVNRYPARDVATLQNFSLEAGDDISVVVPTGTRITVTGKVVKPGEFLLKGDQSLQKAIAMAGGPSADGTLSMVRVMRQGQMFTFDANKTEIQVNLQPNDLVLVEQNQRHFYVLGEVAKSGRYLMEDKREYRVSDALAAAGGLASRGTLRRVYLARPGRDGKTLVKQFHLDEYLKDGKAESNPVLQPGDCLLFGQPKGITLGGATQVLSSFVLFESLVRN